ncbi:MAG TPA: transporter substrate-binding domain-containing protein [Stellaceae bacterium]|nr:transporter substrate-binding domain-containing protein [Stellaceae bacterium]
MRTRRLLLGIAAAILFSGAAQAQTCAPKVPADHLLEAGKWQMSINPTLPPQQFVDSKGELQGLNVELARAMAAKMCLEPVFLRMDFPAMIPGLRASRFDTINTGLFWTDERSKLFYLVPHAQQAISVYTLTNGTLNIAKFDDLAGHVVGVESATYQERKSREVNTEMVARGLKPIDFRAFSTASETVAALRAGQLEAAINIDETANDFVQKNVAKIWLHGLFGTDITFAFRDRALAMAAAEALDALKADGTYDRLFEKFGMTRLADDHFAIRGPGPN